MGGEALYYGIAKCEASSEEFLNGIEAEVKQMVAENVRTEEKSA